MVNHDKIRKDVSTSYARAVKAGGGCCGGGTVAQGALAKLADYTREELDSLPPEAVVSSFGCGNPLAFSEVKEGNVVLDLGSGAGIDLLLAAKKVGPNGRVIGVVSHILTRSGGFEGLGIAVSSNLARRPCSRSGRSGGASTGR